jgi:hypothetical protein
MNEFIQESKNKRAKNRDITFHYTNEEMVKDLIAIIPFSRESQETVLDAGSGKNKVWYNNIPNHCCKYECEIEDGCDYLTQWNKQVNWVIGNPPFSIGWKFLEKSADIATDGIAFLGNINFFNCLNQNRLQQLADKGWFINKIHIVSDNRWFGRYYFIIFRRINKTLFSWNKKSY